MSRKPTTTGTAKSKDENIRNLIADSIARGGQSLFCKYRKNDKPPQSKTDQHARSSLEFRR